MKVTVLVENSLAEGAAQVRPEYGLCLFIEHRGKNILLDTGSSGLFAQNAEALGIDLKRSISWSSPTPISTMAADWPASWRSTPPRR